MSDTLATETAEALTMDPSRGAMAWYHAFKQARYVVPICVLIAVSALLVNVKLAWFTEFSGDTAIFFQLTENIAHRGAPVSGVFANTQSFLDSKLLIAKASDIAHDPLAPPAEGERNMLKFHAYAILYPIAALAKFIPVPTLLLSLYVLSYTGVVLLAFFFLRSSAVPIALALLFCLLMISHPAWSLSLLDGQFYPDRLFIVAGFAFMWVVSRRNSSPAQIITFALLCALINERAALVAGGFLLLHTFLYWRETEKERNVKLGVALALLAIALILTKFVLVNGYYSSFMPTSLNEVLANFGDPTFRQDALLFAAVNAPFVILALFEWRAAVIAIALMLPNLIGHMGGGAEKVGWGTHYASYYLPALYWAAATGCIAALQKMSAMKRTWLAYGLVAVLAVGLNLMNPASSSGVQLSAAKIQQNFLIEFPQDASTYFGPKGSALLAISNSIQQSVPKNVVVSVPEAWMPLLYQDRVLHYFPVGIDRADYAVVDIVGTQHGQPIFGGAVSYLGAHELSNINATVIERMKRDGYDFKDAKIFPSLSVAVVQRKH